MEWISIGFMVKLQVTFFIIGGPLLIITAGEFAVAESKADKIKYGIPFFTGALLVTLAVIAFLFEIWFLI